jgi:hypothetical protein
MDVIEGRVGSPDETEPVGVPVAWYSSIQMKNHQRRIYQIGPSGHYENGKAKQWGLSELVIELEVHETKSNFRVVSKYWNNPFNQACMVKRNIAEGAIVAPENSHPSHSQSV